MRLFHFQVRLDAESVRQTNNASGVLVLDKGSQIWQFNRRNSAGRERFKAAEYVRSIVEERQTHNQFEPIGRCHVIIKRNNAEINTTTIVHV